ncbi:hypothetical protein [Pseudomonas sp. ES3-33]|uniref:hypothetical protein n=1 Tax=Pseudomonas sp. ES3-33 TaxID=1628833 RepID=UPI0005D2F8D3|nr:hypothetical protein [Pseudomonas sp. ES3-33]KJH75362.1 hypothetical protein UB23_19465 [Pseudomonas sp. ES3-33]
MAILVNIEYRGIKIDGAYASVCEPSISTSKDSVSFCVVYRAGPDHDQFTSEMMECFYDLKGENPYSQAYGFLKTLPEFEGCSDC